LHLGKVQEMWGRFFSRCLNFFSMQKREAENIFNLIKTLFSDEELIRECIEDVRKDIECREASKLRELLERFGYEEK